jgi:hypothetical protein
VKRRSGRHGWVAAILHRWPTWFAVALAALHPRFDPTSHGNMNEPPPHDCLGEA